MRATHLIVLLLAIGGVAAAQDAARTWDFQGDKVDEAPAGFSFGKTGQGRPGKWLVRADPDAPAGDHVLAQVDADDTDDRFPGRGRACPEGPAPRGSMQAGVGEDRPGLRPRLSLPGRE